MTKNFYIRNKLLSLRGKISVTDSNGEEVFDAKGQFAFNPKWRIRRGTQEVATVQRKIFSWSPTWLIESELGDFIIRRRIFSWKRTYDIDGGLFNGTIFSGSFFDWNFDIASKGTLIAKAQKEFMSIRDSHAVEIYVETPEAELITFICMVVLLRSKAAENETTTTHGD